MFSVGGKECDGSKETPESFESERERKKFG